MAASLSQVVADYPGLFLAFRVTTISSMIFIAGLSFCLSTWVIPNAFLVPPAGRLRQFTVTVSKGFRYLMRASRIMMVALLTNTYLTAVHPDPEISTHWKTWVTMACVLITAAPYEIYFIFPVNDEIDVMYRQVEKDRQPLTTHQETKLEKLLNKWAFRNYGRVVLPLAAGILGMFTL